ncbi:hypothetical protein AAMO2058_000396100 [Amorphochlora amoebiformis]
MKTKAVACMLAWLLTAVAEQDDPSKPCPKLTENGECPPGSVMNDDGKTCNDIDECLTDNGGCEHFCNNFCMGYRCSCKPGYFLGEDGYSCHPIDCTRGSIVYFVLGGKALDVILPKDVDNGTSVTVPCGESNPEFGCRMELACKNGIAYANTTSCCAHCQLSEWQSSTCSQTCGEGTLVQNREIIRNPDEGGEKCGDLVQTIPCNEGCCPVDCEMSNFTDVGACSATCGCGATRMVRKILRNASCGGTPCGPRIDYKPCFINVTCPDEYVEQSWSWWWPFSWPWWGGEKSPSDPVDTPSDESPLADIDLYEEPPKDNDVDDVYPPEDDGDEIPDEPIDVVPPKPDCEYGEWQDVGPCKGKCGEKGTQKRMREPVTDHERCEIVIDYIECETFCGVEARIWKSTICHGANLDGKHLEGFFNATEFEYCRDQHNSDALALSNCIERCDAVESCAGFVFARGLNSTARCCFRSDTTTKIHKQSAFTCVEKKKKYKRSRSSVHTEKEEDDSLESTGSTDLKGVDA